MVYVFYTNRLSYWCKMPCKEPLQRTDKKLWPDTIVCRDGSKVANAVAAGRERARNGLSFVQHSLPIHRSFFARHLKNVTWLPPSIATFTSY